MATQDPKTPTRTELSSFLPNHYMVRAFEHLFDQVNTIQESDIAALTILIDDAIANSGTADDKAQSAIDGLSELQKTLVFGAEAASQRVLDLLLRISEDLSLNVSTAYQKAQEALDGVARTFNQVIENAGTPVTQRRNVNFTGAGVSVADSGGKTVVTVSSGGGGSPNLDGGVSGSTYGAVSPIDGGPA